MYSDALGDYTSERLTRESNIYVCLYHSWYIHTASTYGDANTRRYIDISTLMH